MVLVALTLALILAGVVAYFIGAAKLAKYAFRISTGHGVAVLLFPPYTFYFAFARLEVDGKELPTALCCFGIVLVALLTAIFWQPLSMTFTGDLDEVDEMMTAETAPDEYRAAPEEVVDAVEQGDEEALEDVDEDVIEEAEEQLEEEEDS